MKCIILCWDEDCSWVADYVPGTHPYMLKIAGKPLLEYYIDLCSLAGVGEVRIVSETPDVSLEEYFSTGEKWGLDISYSIAKEGDSIEQVLKKNSSFAGEEDLFIVSGYVFPYYDKNKKDFPFLSMDGAHRVSNGNGLICRLASKKIFEEAKEYNGDDLSIASITNMREYFEISMDVLKNRSSNYVLPGYNNEEGVFIGQEVEIARNAKINPPVVILDKVKLKELVSIGPNSIIGNNVIVDKDAIVADSIVYDGSYIGLDLEIRKKFVHRSTLADAGSGELMEIADDFLISGLSKSELMRKPIFLLHVLGALFLILSMLPGYLIAKIVQLVAGGVKYDTKEFYVDKDGERLVTLSIAERYRGWNVFNHLFFKLSLFKLPQLMKVLSGELQLIGNAPKAVSEAAKEELNEMVSYYPSVFSYSEMLSSPDTEDFENHINELYYQQNASFMFNLSIIIKSLFRNLFK